MPTTLRNRSSLRLALYSLAFRLLRRVALSGENRRETTPALTSADRTLRRIGRPAKSLEQAQGGSPGVRCSLCPPGGEQ